MNRISNNKKNSKKGKKQKENEEYDIPTIKSKKKTQKAEEQLNSNKNIKKEKKKKKEKKSGIGKFFLKLFLLIIILLAIIGVLFYKKMEENGGGIQGALITVFGLSVENIEELDTINVLLLGISEDIETELTDTIIVCSYNPKNQRASMISIPRDTFIGKNKLSAKGSDKINSLYARDTEKLFDKVSEITGIEVEYYAVVKTQALIQIVDILGGVNFEVPIDMDYDDPTQDLHIHLKQGMQKIDGKKAEQLLRFRHNNDGSSYPAEYGDNDYGRMKTQRTFITETINQTLNFKNIFKAKEIVDTVFANIETNIVVEDLLPYIVTAVDFNPENIVSNQLPGASEKCNDLWFFIHDKKETKKLVESLEILN